MRTNQDSTNFPVEALHPSLTIEGGPEVVKRVVLLAIYVLLDAGWTSSPKMALTARDITGFMSVW